MVINISVQQYNGGLLPDIILPVDPRLLPLGNPFKYHVVCGYLGVLLAANRVFSLLSDNTGMVPRTFWTWFGRFLTPARSSLPTDGEQEVEPKPPLATLLLESPFQPPQKS